MDRDKVRNAAQGLSPRVRGNLYDEAGWQVQMRSIPACAGEPISRIRDRAANEVYPRVCGGTQDVVVRRLVYQGLSPRVRGNQKQDFGKLDLPGSIPACAGEPPYMRPVG